MESSIGSIRVELRQGASADKIVLPRTNGVKWWKMRAERWRLNHAARFCRTRAAGSGWNSLARNFKLYNNGLMTDTRGRVCGRARGGYMVYGREGTTAFFLFELATLTYPTKSPGLMT